MKKNLFFALSALVLGVAATSCSSDDELTQAPDKGEVTDSYLRVDLLNVGSSVASRDDDSTKDTSITDKLYAYGSDDENAIAGAVFIFFDENGDWVSQTDISKAISLSGTNTDTNPVNNVEKYGEYVLPVNNIQTNYKPTKLVTILNPPADFVTCRTLSELYSTLTADMYKNVKSGESDTTGKDYFTMSTSTYMNTDAKSAVYVTTLEAEDFHATEALAKADTTPVKIYVERLAAKVEVTDVDFKAEKVKSLADHLFKLGDYVIFGQNNDQQQGVYVKLCSWGLNGTSPKSYLLKNINTSWDLGFTWNAESDVRSYWAQSQFYGQGGYPEYYVKADYKNYKLNYYSQNEHNGAFSTATTSAPQYCFENTNTSDVLSTKMVNGTRSFVNYQAATTSALIVAQLVDENGKPFTYKDENGNDVAQNFVKYNGRLYTYDGYAQFVYDNFKGTADFKDILASDVQISKGDFLNGRVIVQLNGDGVGHAGDKAESINATLAAFNNDRTNDAVGYVSGFMYYNVPIKHLNATLDTRDDYDLLTIPEGHYGVVRNHWYILSITDIQNLGHGIIDPDEPIVPNPDTDDYFINLKINILSWKQISQTVTL
jgi:hypothetical protein